MTFRLPLPVALRGALLLGLLALVPQIGFGQAAQTAVVAPPTYDFLTITTYESRVRDSKIVIAPPFQGKAEIPLEDVDVIFNSKGKRMEMFQRNALLIRQQLTDLTTAGWELFQAYPLGYAPGTIGTCYLFRKARR